MRKRYRVLILAAIVVALAVPMGRAFSLKPGTVPPSATPAMALAVAPSSVVAVATVPWVRRSGGLPLFPGVPDSTKLFCMGAVLFGLAAAAKRALFGPPRTLLAPHKPIIGTCPPGN